MMIKVLWYLMFIVCVWGGLSGVGEASQERKIYPLPKTETEQIVVEWLSSMGYQLHRSIIDKHGIRIYACQNRRIWKIVFWPYSPLATSVMASYTTDGSAEQSEQQLWNLLDDHVRAIANQPADKHSEIPEAILPKIESVVCIYVGYPEKPLQISGFIIDKKGLIICTAHGLKNLDQPLTVTLRNGRKLQGRVVQIHKDYDLSLVDVQTELDVQIDLASGRDLATGETERLYNVVCARNSDGSVFPGRVSGPPRKTGQEVLWQVNMKIRPGSSGSPVFDPQGHLVAIVKGRYRDSEKVGFLIPFASLMTFISDCSK